MQNSNVRTAQDKVISLIAWPIMLLPPSTWIYAHTLSRKRFSERSRPTMAFLWPIIWQSLPRPASARKRRVQSGHWKGLRVVLRHAIIAALSSLSKLLPRWLAYRYGEKKKMSKISHCTTAIAESKLTERAYWALRQRTGTQQNWSIGMNLRFLSCVYMKRKAFIAFCCTIRIVEVTKSCR